MTVVGDCCWQNESSHVESWETGGHNIKKLTDSYGFDGQQPTCAQNSIDRRADMCQEFLLIGTESHKIVVNWTKTKCVQVPEIAVDWVADEVRLGPRNNYYTHSVPF